MGIVKFELCSQAGTYIRVDDLSETLSPGKVYSATESGITVCGIFTAGPPPSGGTTYTVGTLFDSCVECNQYIPSSANTEYTLCTYDCDGNPIVLEFPHPVWTNNYGNAVTQLNAVTLGGPDGLNN